MRCNAALTRVTCSGIVDADDYQPEDKATLKRLGIEILPVSEIENIVLLPEVGRTIVANEGYDAVGVEAQLDALKVAIFASVNSPAAIESVVTRYCQRRIDRLLKKIDLSSAADVAALAAEDKQKTGALDIGAIAAEATTRIKSALGKSDLLLLLANYDNKGLLALAAAHLRKSRLTDFESWFTRVLQNDKVPGLQAAVRDILPAIYPQ